MDGSPAVEKLITLQQTLDNLLVKRQSLIVPKLFVYADTYPSTIKENGWKLLRNICASSYICSFAKTDPRRWLQVLISSPEELGKTPACNIFSDYAYDMARGMRVHGEGSKLVN
jgi:hypothetical protein